MSAAPTGDGEPTVWADAHNHLHDPRLDAARDAAPECVVNATCEDDWAEVLAVTTSPGRHAALGIHPWFAHTATVGWDERLRELLTQHPAASIGECGLDGKSKTCPLDVQTTVFTRQLALARELDRPLTIHCVAAWGRLLDLLDENPHHGRFLLHSFSGSVETVNHLVKMGGYLSISARALLPSGEKILRVFQTIPKDRILLESDAPNHPLDLASTGPAIAEKLGITPTDFARLTRQNLHQFLGLDC